MAIYHLNAKTGNRARGQSAAAKAAYITATEKYARKRGVVFTGFDNMPAWATDNPLRYWKAADEFERANARLFREVEFALPVDLDNEQRLELAKEFARQTAQTTDGQPLPYMYAIHDKKDDNPHCHLLISERINDNIERSPETWFVRHNDKKPGETGAKKTRDLKPKNWLLSRREAWAVTANQWLAKAGINGKLDHRSNKARGIDRPPGKHVGPEAWSLEKKGIRTERGELYRDSIFDQRLYDTLKYQEESHQKDVSLLQQVLELQKHILQEAQKKTIFVLQKIKQLFVLRENQQQEALNQQQEQEKEEKIFVLQKSDDEGGVGWEAWEDDEIVEMKSEGEKEKIENNDVMKKEDEQKATSRSKLSELVAQLNYRDKKIKDNIVKQKNLKNSDTKLKRLVKQINEKGKLKNENNDYETLMKVRDDVDAKTIIKL
jgi:hypothetical protein